MYATHKRAAATAIPPRLSGRRVLLSRQNPDVPQEVKVDGGELGLDQSPQTPEEMRGLETERRSKRMSEHTNIPRSLSAVSLPTRPPRRDRPKDALPALYFEMLHTHTAVPHCQTQADAAEKTKDRFAESRTVKTKASPDEMSLTQQITSTSSCDRTGRSFTAYKQSALLFSYVILKKNAALESSRKPSKPLPLQHT